MATYVLVHGAYQGGWIWKPVADRLRAAGHRVHAPTLDGCAERHDQVRSGITAATHGQEVAKLLFYEDLARVIPSTRPSHSAWKTGSFFSRSTRPKPCIPPMSWIPFTSRDLASHCATL